MRTHGGENLSNNLVFRQIIQYWDANLQASGTIFAHVYLRAYLNGKLFVNIFRLFFLYFTKKMALTAQLA